MTSKHRSTSAILLDLLGRNGYRQLASVPLNEAPFVVGRWSQKNLELQRYCTSPPLELIRSHRGSFTIQGQDPAGEFYIETNAPKSLVLEAYRQSIPVMLVGLERRQVISSLVTRLAREHDVDRRWIIATAFLTPKGGRFPAHFDCRDVWILGLAGNKRFRASPNLDVPFPDVNAFAKSQHPRFRDYGVPTLAPPTRWQHTANLSRGVSLFIPHGHWHDTAGAESSVSLSIGLARPSRLKILNDVIQKTLPSRLDWRTPVQSHSELLEFRRHSERVVKAELLRFYRNIQSSQEKKA